MIKKGSKEKSSNKPHLFCRLIFLLGKIFFALLFLFKCSLNKSVHNKIFVQNIKIQNTLTRSKIASNNRKLSSLLWTSTNLCSSSTTLASSSAFLFLVDSSSSFSRSSVCWRLRGKASTSCCSRFLVITHFFGGSFLWHISLTCSLRALKFPVLFELCPLFRYQFLPGLIFPWQFSWILEIFRFGVECDQSQPIDKMRI